MKVDIVTCYESNEERMSFVYDACLNRGYDVEAITSDFSHIRKEKRNNIPAGYTAISTMPYRKNLSLKRMLSHRRFAKDAFSHLNEKKPDMIWLMAPANSLIMEAMKYKEKNPETKIIIDIIDMWPESLPLGIDSSVFPLNIWRNIRKDNLVCADAVVTECDLYQDILKNEYRGKMTTIHWGRDMKAEKNQSVLSDDLLVLCYIGSINNIIDTERISAMIAGIQMPVKLHVIGEGENKDIFLSELKKVCDVHSTKA